MDLEIAPYLNLSVSIKHVQASGSALMSVCASISGLIFVMNMQLFVWGEDLGNHEHGFSSH